jgi:hypothetical protein
VTTALLLLSWGFLLGFMFAWFLQDQKITTLKHKNDCLYEHLRAERRTTAGLRFERPGVRHLRVVPSHTQEGQ